jgi:uncharacterized protein YcbX
MLRLSGCTGVSGRKCATRLIREEDEEVREFQKHTIVGRVFADCAPYLGVSEKSLHDISKRLPDDQPMDVRKYRPNIIISEADEAWEEDFWTEIQVMQPTESTGNIGQRMVSLGLPHNCVRCCSVNVDFKEGKFATNESGKVLKLMQKDRRVDKGAKWSPVFGTRPDTLASNRADSNSRSIWVPLGRGWRG